MRQQDVNNYIKLRKTKNFEGVNFSASNGVLFHYLNAVKPYFATSIISWIYHPSRNPKFSREMNLDNNFFSQTAIILTKILYMQLHKYIGLKPT